VVQNRVIIGFVVLFSLAEACSSEKPHRVALPSSVASSTTASTFRDDFAIAFGSRERACISTGDHDVVRSGNFVAGPFVSYRQYWLPDQPPDIGKLYWEPEDDRHVAKVALVVTAVARGLDTEPPSTWRFGGTGFAATTARGNRFYPSGLHLPHRGQWRLTATAGTQWGCFDFEL
jgi:hypothetical protein